METIRSVNYRGGEIMPKGECRAILESLSRIELLITTVMESKYGREETNRVYKEVSNIIREQFNKFNTLDEPLPGQMTLEDFDENN